jgi:hypothetical protein
MRIHLITKQDKRHHHISLIILSLKRKQVEQNLPLARQACAKSAQMKRGLRDGCAYRAVFFSKLHSHWSLQSSSADGSSAGAAVEGEAHKATNLGKQIPSQKMKPRVDSKRKAGNQSIVTAPLRFYKITCQTPGDHTERKTGTR